MKYINLILAALMGVSFSFAAPTLAKDIIQGLGGNYTMADIQWEVPISPDHTDTVTGTIEDVIRHLQVVAPELLEAQDVSVPGLEPLSDHHVPFDGALVKTPAPGDIKCGNLERSGFKKRILQGVSYLRKVSGKPTNGPNSCGQVSCSWKSAITWCNDKSDSLTLDSFGMIADGAQAVTDRCGADIFDQTNGQSFYDDGWNVMVSAGDC